MTDRSRTKKLKASSRPPKSTPATAVGHGLRTSIASLLLIGGTVLVLAVFLSIFTLSEPYHVDTTAYFDAIDKLSTGHVVCGYATRCMVSYFLIPFAIAGTHAVKAGLLLAALAFFVLSYLFLARVFSQGAAYLSSLLLLVIPASLITVTHLKEDFVALMFLALALLLATARKPPWRLASPVFFGFSLLSKESSVLFAPLYVSIHAYFLFMARPTDIRSELRRRSTWIFAAMIGVIPFAIAIAIKHDYLGSLAHLGSSPYLGQFKGPFSSLLPTGWALFKRGVGFELLFWFQLSALALLYLEKDWRKRVLSSLFIANAILIAMFSMNNTVMTYRNFVIVAFLTFPPAIYALELTIPQRWLLYVAGALLVIPTAAKSLPYIAFHARYNTQEHFLGVLKGKLQAEPVLLTMDYSGLIRHYLGVETKQHVPDADDAQAESFVKAIKSDAGKSYYLFPDAISYDSKNTIRPRLQQGFQFEPIEKAWFEDYHTMDYGYSEGELGSILEKQTGCKSTLAIGGRTSIGSVAMDVYRYKLDCGDKGTTDSEYPGYMGKVFPSLLQAQVYRLASPASH